jgi:hypothetical protein
MAAIGRLLSAPAILKQQQGDDRGRDQPGGKQEIGALLEPLRLDSVAAG